VALDNSFAGVNPTGVGLYAFNLSRALRRIARAHRFDMRCYGPNCPRPLSRGFTLPAIVHEWPLYTHGLLPLVLWGYRPHIVHATSHIGPLWAPGKLLVTVHDLIFLRYPEDYDPLWRGLTLMLLPHVLRRAQAIIADSHTTRTDILRFYRVAPPRVRVIYPGVDHLSGVTAAPWRYPTGEEGRPVAVAVPGIVPAGKPYILCPGPLVRRKNHEVVIEAFARLVSAPANQYPGEVHLVIMGSAPAGMKQGPLAARLASLPPHIRSRIHLVGYVARRELASLLASAALLAYPSRFEGFGLPPLEAMAAGVPVVASDTPAVLEATGGAALTASTHDPRQWQAAFSLILTNPSIAEALRQSGKQRAAQFTWERTAAQVVALYEELLSPTVAGAGPRPDRHFI
jgi:glycosyltransferase involved in cell wall biosynthesis